MTPDARSRAKLLGEDGAPGASSEIMMSARTLLTFWALEVDRHLPRALSSLEPGPLHDARVASRRLRVGLGMFRDLYPRWKRAKSRARTVTRALRHVRDLDIRCARLGRLSRTAGSAGAGRFCLLLLEEAEGERRKLRGVRGARPVPGPAGGGTVAPFEAGSWRGPARAPPAAPRPEMEASSDLGRIRRSSGRWMAPFIPLLGAPRERSASRATRRALSRLRDLSRRARSLLGPASVEDLSGVQHRLRITCKKLRYTLEFLERVLGARARFRIATLRRVQDVLGEVHDIDVLTALASGRAGELGPEWRGPAETVLGAQRSERARHFKRFLAMRGELERALAPPVPISPRRARRAGRGRLTRSPGGARPARARPSAGRKRPGASRAPGQCRGAPS